MDEVNTNSKQFVIFSLEGEEYGIEILRVKEIKEMIRITRVPKAPHYVRGVINLRGEVIPIVDLRKKFNLEKRNDNDSTRIIIVAVEEITVGLVVDTSSEVVGILNKDIEEAPETIGSFEQGYISGIGKVGSRLIILLNVDKILINN